MKISPEYGPQLDVNDGTIGKIKLVQRYVLVKYNGKLFHPAQGRYTYSDEVSTGIDKFLANYPPESRDYPLVKCLRVEKWWCFPEHFDPIAKVPENLDEQSCNC